MNRSNLTLDAGLGRVDAASGDEINHVTEHECHKDRARMAVVVAGHAENRAILSGLLVELPGIRQEYRAACYEVPDEQLLATPKF